MFKPQRGKRDRRRFRTTTTALAVAAGLTLTTLAGALSPMSANAAEPVDRALAYSLGLVPLPAQLEAKSGAAFKMTNATRFVAEGAEPSRIAEIVAAPMRVSTGFELPVVSGAARTGDIKFVVDTSRDFGAVAADDLYGENEAYAIDVTAGGITVTGASEHGLWNAAQTLPQLFPPAIDAKQKVNFVASAPALSMVDGPRFAWRGTMLDTARSMYYPDEVKKHIDQVSRYKISVLHLHIADDQGWRIEITNEGKEPGDPIDYTKLTGVGGGTAMTTAPLGETGRTGFFTQKQFRELVAYAESRYITIVPEIDLPGHTNSILHSIPELNTMGSSWRDYLNTPSRWVPAGVTPVERASTVNHNGTGSVGYSYLDPDDELTYTFIRHVLKQIADMTPGAYLGTGGDEVASFTTRYGYPKFAETVTRILGIVHDLGKKAYGWSEIADGKLQPGDAIQYWNPAASVVNLRTRLQEGAKVVMSYGYRGYIDMKYWGRNPVGATWACNPGNDWSTGTNACDFPNYYDWNPALPPYNSTDPDRIFTPPLEESEILGVEPPLWSETLRGIDQVEFLVFPRILSFAEMGWTPQELRTGQVQDFTNRIQQVGQRLTFKGTNFGDGTPKNVTSGNYPLTTDFSKGWSYTTISVDAGAPEGRAADINVGLVSAPGTTMTSDATGLTSSPEVYNTSLPLFERAIQRSTSAVTRSNPDGTFRVMVDWGDGTAPTPATFSTDQKRDTVHTPSVYRLTANHAYAKAGVYNAKLIGSDGVTLPFKVAVSLFEDLEVTVLPGSLNLSVPYNPVVNLGTVTATAEDQMVAATMNAARVVDSRGTNEGWTLTGTASNFVGDATGKRILSANLGWAPYASVVPGADLGLVSDNETQTPLVTAGPVVAPAKDGGLGTPKTLCSSPEGASSGRFSCAADLKLGIPWDTAADHYTSVLTLTLI